VRKKDLTRWDPYSPLKKHQKFDQWVQHSYSPLTLLSALTAAGWGQLVGEWPSYGDGMDGFGRRLAATATGAEAGGFLKVFLLPTLFHEDPRYFPMRRGNFFARAWYVAARVVVTRNDNGGSTVNLPEILGVFAVRAVQNAYYPKEDRTFGQTIGGGGIALGANMEANALREFWPDIARLFHKPDGDGVIGSGEPPPGAPGAAPRP
jgi:hypothetical protein